MAQPEIKQTIRMQGKYVETLLAEMNTQISGVDSVQRITKRWVMQAQKIVMTMVGEHGDRAHYVTIPRNISTHGISVLHGGFMHTGRKCIISIRSVNGKAESVSGEIVRCRHVRGGVHEIGIRFENAVNPREFFVDTGDDYLFDAEHVDASELNGRVLLVCDSDADKKLIEHLFSESEIQFTFAEDAASGLEQLSAEPDLAFVDDALKDMNGIEFVTEARRRALTTPVVLISQQHDEEMRLAAIGAGAREVVHRPIDPSVILRATAEFLMLSPMLGAGSTTQLDGSADEDSRALFATELIAISEQIKAALAEKDESTLDTHLSRLSSAAGVYGYPDLSTRASGILDKIRNRASVDAVRGQVERLGELCKIRGEEPRRTTPPEQDEAKDAA